MNYREFKQKQEEEANQFTKGKIFFAFGTSEEEVKDELDGTEIKIIETAPLSKWSC